MKPDEKKEIETGVILLILIVIIIAASGGAFYFLTPIANLFLTHTTFFNGAISGIFDALVVISIPLSLVLFIGIIISTERLKTIRRKEHEMYDGVHVEEAYVPAGLDGGTNAGTTGRWKKIVVMADSDNQNDWKQAIIDADSILDELLTKMNYHGDDLGSKLRGATKADFKTLDQAWDAHKVRNDIAHSGSDFLLSKHEARRVINLYKQIFEEFFLI